MPQRTFSLTDEASQKIDRMAAQEDRTLTAVLNRIIMQASSENGTRRSGEGDTK